MPSPQRSPRRRSTFTLAPATVRPSANTRAYPRSSALPAAVSGLRGMPARCRRIATTTSSPPRAPTTDARGATSSSSSIPTASGRSALPIPACGSIPAGGCGCFGFRIPTKTRPRRRFSPSQLTILGTQTRAGRPLGSLVRALRLTNPSCWRTAIGCCPPRSGVAIKAVACSPRTTAARRGSCAAPRAYHASRTGSATNR